MEDATSHKRDAVMIHADESKYRSLFESSRDAIMTLEAPDWRFTSANPATVTLFRAKDVEDFISRGPWDYSPEKQPDGMSSMERAKERIEEAVKNGSAFFEWQHKRLTGEDFPATVLLTRTIVDGKPILQATVRDITEEKNLQQHLHKKIDELEFINKLAVEREMKMVELKQEVAALRKELDDLREELTVLKNT